jgi:hypothetical protein
MAARRASRSPVWRDFARCRAEPDGLHEVYFEYDDELEYIARARDADREITRWAGTTEVIFPVRGVGAVRLRWRAARIRMVTDAGPSIATTSPRPTCASAPTPNMLGGIMAARFDIETARDCMSSPPAEGESAVGTCSSSRAAR